MASEHDPVNWIVPQDQESITIVFFEPAGNLDVYLAVYRITNTSESPVFITTAELNQLTLLGQLEDAQPASIDLSSTKITIGRGPGHAGRHPPILSGTYQLLCCSVGRIPTLSETLHGGKKSKPTDHAVAKRKPTHKAD